jgi:hypothetical protein
MPMVPMMPILCLYLCLSCAYICLYSAYISPICIQCAVSHTVERRRMYELRQHTSQFTEAPPGRTVSMDHTTRQLSNLQRIMSTRVLHHLLYVYDDPFLFNSCGTSLQRRF